MIYCRHPFLMRVAWTMALSVMVAVGAANAIDQAPPDVTAPAAATRPNDGVNVLRRLLRENPLRISTDDPEPPTNFQFVLRLSVTRKQAETVYTDYVVIKDGDRVGVLIRSIDGLPYCYLTEGLLVMIDRGQPGRLVVYDQGSPEFVFKAIEQEAGRLEFGLSHAKQALKSRIVLDLGSVLREAVSRMQSVTFERDTGTLLGHTERAVVMIVLPAIDSPGGFGIRTFVTRSGIGQTLSFMDLATGVPPPFRPGQVDAKAVKALGLPSRDLAEVERAGVSLLIPDGFGNDPRERQAAEKLASLFRKQPVERPASRPHD